MMDSNSGKHRRRPPGRRPGGIAPKHSRRQPLPSDWGASESFATPTASRRTIRLPEPKREPPVFRLFLAAFCGVALLVLLGGGQHSLPLGLALLLPGAALIFKPPTTGLGKLGDLGFVGLLACLLLAFVPAFYWPTAEWRLEAVETLGIQLPSLLSVQPWISFEAWLLTLAGFSWFYAALQWPVNTAGRRWLYFWLSFILCGLAGYVVWGNLVGARYLGADDARVVSFFTSRSQTDNFLVLGGVTSFAYAMGGVRSRTLLPLMGLPASALCLTGLVLGASRMGVLLYVSGIALWFACSLCMRSVPRLFKFLFPLVILAFACIFVTNERGMHRAVNFFSAELQPSSEQRLNIYQDAIDMVLEAPISGVGLGTFSAVFPQYREQSANTERIMHPSSDIIWLATEGGLLAVGCLAFFLISYFLNCRGMTEGASVHYRLLALVAVIVFILHGLFDVAGHRPGSVYFAILFAVLALPKRVRPTSCFPRLVWRAVGAMLMLVGFVWLLAGVFNAPWHSSIRLDRVSVKLESDMSVQELELRKSSIDEWVSQWPLDWHGYSQRGQLALLVGVELEQAEADFLRARFVEPIMGEVSYVEGEAWLPYDTDRAVAAWRETLHREVIDMDQLYNQMLGQMDAFPGLLPGMKRLSEISPHFRAFFLGSLKGEDLKQEIIRELAQDPALDKFNLKQRTSIVKNWILHGDHETGADFLAAYGDSLQNTWWLRSLLLKNRADFEQAIVQIRDKFELPSMPTLEMDDAYVLTRLAREYAVSPGDIIKGSALFSAYYDEGAYSQALSVVDRLLEVHQSELYLYYWRAECLYQLQDYIESWYAFETYLVQLWSEK